MSGDDLVDGMPRELCCRAIASQLVYFRELHGRENLEKVIAQAFPDGEVALPFVEDINNWIPFRVGQRILDTLTDASLDPNFPRKAGLMMASRESLGFAYNWIRAFGSPKLCYKMLVENAHAYNRVGTFKILELSSQHCVFSYESTVTEPNLRMSQYRLAQFESFPTIWGLPPARSEVLQCPVANNDPAFVYSLRWMPPRSNLEVALAAVVGAASGGALSLAVPWSAPWWSLSIVGAGIGMLFILALRAKQTVRRLSSTLDEHNQDLTAAMHHLTERFYQVRALNESLEQKVQQRTAALGRANEQLKELDKAKSQFFATISHELRTPLALTLGPVETLIHHGATPEQREQLLVVRENQLRLLRNVEELLALAQLESGTLKATFEPVDVRELTRRMGRAAHGAMEHANISFATELSDQPLQAYVDLQKIERVVLNLLNNALKFTDAGGRVALGLVREGDYAVVSVADSGIGIPEDKLASVFDRFFQVDGSETRTYQGTGIGLSLVKEYAELHGGSVEVTSELGKGTTFSVRLKLGKAHLPAEQVVDENDAADTAARLEGYERELAAEGELHGDQPEAALETSVRIRRATGMQTAVAPSPSRPTDTDEHAMLQDARVLVVEDTPSMRRYICSLLAPHYEVVAARDGVEGLEKAHELHPDLILSDVMMPRMSGRELCERIRTDPGPISTTPIVLVTARAEEDAKLQSLGHGADDYLLKPFLAEELRLRVRNLVVKHRQRSALRSAYQQLRAHKRYIDGDLRAARTFQRSLLPPLKLPAPLAGHVEYHPADPVGGDFYHALTLPDGRVRLLVADMVDHGVKAALRTTAAWAEYTAIDHAACSPAEALSELGRKAAGKYKDLSGSCIVLDLQAHDDHAHIRYAQAGELTMTVVTAGEATEVPPAEGFILGLLENARYETKELSLQRGERLFVYTDGLLDQRDGASAHFGEQVIADTWATIHEKPSVAAATGALMTAFHEFRGDHPQLDDVTLIGLEMGP